MRKIGRFTFTEGLLTEASVGLFQPFVITHLEHKHDAIEFTAISPLFDEIEEGEIIPEYEIIITEDKVGNRIFEVNKVYADTETT